MSERLGNVDFNDYLQNDGRVYGVLAAVVINNDSSSDKSKPGPGRVKVEIPILGMKESNWARIASFMAGKGRGAFFLPQVGDEVLVAFENGDVNKPYIIGSLWNGKDSPPAAHSFKSLSGHTIQFIDKKDEEKIQIIDKSGNNKIIIDTKNNKIAISSDKDIEISAPKGKLVLNAKNVEIKASADMVIKGATVNIN